MTVRRQLFVLAAVATTAVLGAGSAFAAEAWAGVGIGEGEVIQRPAQVASTTTRAQVIAQFNEARRQDTLLASGEVSRAPVLASAQPSRSRAEVKLETAQANRRGELMGAGESLQAARPAAAAASAQRIAGLR